MSLLIAAIAVPAQAKPRKSARNKTFTVVIDAGHGGKDTGAADNSVFEKDINLSVAKALEAKLKKDMKNVEVVMTRDNDTFISLQGRADKANQAKADLFISIHTNSVDAKNPNRKSVAGASVYALGLHKEGNNMAVARRENAVIELEKNYEQTYKGFNPDSDESYMLFEMANKQNLMQSIKFAKEVQKQLVSTAGRRDRGVHQAGFWVLWATAMPSVLIELDFICNPNSAKYMASTQGSEKLAEAIFNAVKKYRTNLEKTTLAAAAKQNAAEADAPDPAGQESAFLMAASDTPDRVVTEAPHQQNVSSSVSTKRRRRSAASRMTSDKRVLEASSAITVKTHTRTTRAAAKATVAAASPTNNDADAKSTDTRKSKNAAASKKSNSSKKDGRKNKKEKEKRKGNTRTRIFNNKVITIGEETADAAPAAPAKKKSVASADKQSVDSKVASRFDRDSRRSKVKEASRKAADAPRKADATAKQTASKVKNSDKLADAKVSKTVAEKTANSTATVGADENNMHRASLHSRSRRQKK